MRQWLGILLLSLLIGCSAPATSGGDHNNHGSADTPKSGAREVSIDATDFAFSPKEIRIKAGETVNLVLNNKGALEHDLQIKQLNFHLHTLAGKIGRGVFTVKTAGRYEITCEVIGHKEQGMVMTLIVE